MMSRNIARKDKTKKKKKKKKSECEWRHSIDVIVT